MTEPTIETLARRLDKVERENRHLRRRIRLWWSVLWAIFLVGAPSLGHAERCAFVLWEKLVMTEGSTKEKIELVWEPITSFDLAKECEAHKENSMASRTAKAIERGDEIVAVTIDMIVTRSKSGDVAVISNRCLPDTIDLRR